MSRRSGSDTTSCKTLLSSIPEPSLRGKRNRRSTRRVYSFNHLMPSLSSQRSLLGLPRGCLSNCCIDTVHHDWPGAFEGRKVHLLGGGAVEQARLMHEMDVISADSNLAAKLANRGLVVGPKGRALPDSLKKHLGKESKSFLSLSHAAFQLSLRNLRAYWESVDGIEIEWNSNQRGYHAED